MRWLLETEALRKNPGTAGRLCRVKGNGLISFRDSLQGIPREAEAPGPNVDGGGRTVSGDGLSRRRARELRDTGVRVRYG